MLKPNRSIVKNPGIVCELLDFGRSMKEPSTLGRLNYELEGPISEGLQSNLHEDIRLQVRGESVELLCKRLSTLQNCIMLIPRGPSVCPIFGLGLATPARTLRFTVAL